MSWYVLYLGRNLTVDLTGNYGGHTELNQNRKYNTLVFHVKKMVGVGKELEAKLAYK